MWIRDTLEHCPFESLKAAAVGILKDELIRATSPHGYPGSVPGSPLPPASPAPHSPAPPASPLPPASPVPPATPSSIFGMPVVIDELFPYLFPDIADIFSGNEQQKWEAFTSLYPTIMATVNLYYFLLLSPATRERLGVVRKENADKVEARYLRPLRKVTEGFKGRVGSGEEEGGMEVELLGNLLDTVEDLKEKWVE